MLQAPGAGTTLVCVNLPLSKMAMAMKGLKVEPGGYKPCMVRLIIGVSQFSFKAFQFSLSMPSMNKLGSNDGLDTKAKTPPVCGSIATTAPRRLPSNSSAFCCMRMSMAKRRVWPLWAGVLFKTRMMLPAASFSTSCMPGMPCSCGS